MGVTNLVRLCGSLGPAVVRTQSRARSYRSIRCFSIPADGSVTYLRNGQNGAEVYLVGTCHVSNKSAEHVKEVIVGKLVDVLSFNVIIRLLKAGRRLEEMVGNVFLKDAIEKFSERDFARQIMEIMAVECPEIMRVLINHRDQVMFKHLRSCEGKVVGVVGMGHMDGIERLWKHVEQNMLKDKNETLECSPNAK